MYIIYDVYVPMYTYNITCTGLYILSMGVPKTGMSAEKNFLYTHNIIYSDEYTRLRTLRGMCVCVCA